MQCTDYKSDNYITLIITLKVYITTQIVEQIQQ